MPLRHFILNGSCEEVTIDLDQRTLVRGETYAFRNPAGDHFLARITSVRQAQRAVVDRYGCEVIGRVITLH